MSVSYWNDKSKNPQKIEADVCIVGAGISGLSTAYWLNQEDPKLKIVILDKGEMASGATGRNAGFITCGSVEHFNRMVSKHGEQQALEIWRFAEKNMELLQSEIFQKSYPPKSFRQQGAFSLAAQDSEFNELKQVADLMSRNQIPVEVLSESDIENRLGAVGFSGGIKYLKDGESDPVELLRVLRNQVRANLYENSEVFRVDSLVGGLRNVVAKGLNVQCTLVIFCTNGYSVGLDPYFADKIYPTRGQVMVFEPIRPFLEGPCYANFYLDYFRQLHDGALLIGGFRQLEADTEKGFSEHTTETIQQALHDFVRKHLPKFKDAKVSHRWAGVMGFSVDGEPMIGSLPTDQQVFFMGGFTGHGLGMAFHTSKCLVNLIYDRPVPEWLSARRF